MTALAPRDAVRFRAMVRRVHNLGQRPLGELLLEVAGNRERLLELLERYGRYDPALVVALGATDWLDPPLWAVPA